VPGRRGYPAGMYLIPIALIVLLALIAVAWSPIFALIFFVIGFVAFLVYAGMARRADEKLAPPERPGRQPHHENEVPTGPWGERRQ
jgi:Flp pilus assembly protein TadB